MEQSIEDVYSVVADVESYNQYVPYCLTSRQVDGPRNLPTSQSKPTTDDSRTNYYELAIGFQWIHEKYVSKVGVTPNISVVATAIDSSTFLHLRATWRFCRLDQGCLVLFETEFEFRSYLYAYVANMVFKRVTKEMIIAFQNRCVALFGGEMGTEMPWSNGLELFSTNSAVV